MSETNVGAAFKEAFKAKAASRPRPSVVCPVDGFDTAKVEKASSVAWFEHLRDEHPDQYAKIGA